MRKSIEGFYHWISVGCMAGAVGMICAGHTVWEPFLQSRGDVSSLLYWSACAAFGVATVGFSYLALATAQRHLHKLEARRHQVAPPPSAARFSLVKN